MVSHDMKYLSTRGGDERLSFEQVGRGGGGGGVRVDVSRDSQQMGYVRMDGDPAHPSVADKTTRMHPFAISSSFLPCASTEGQTR